MFVFSGLKPWPYCIEERSPVTTRLYCLLFHSLYGVLHWQWSVLNHTAVPAPAPATAECWADGNAELTACHVLLSALTLLDFTALHTQTMPRPSPLRWWRATRHRIGSWGTAVGSDSPTVPWGRAEKSDYRKGSPSASCCQNSQRQSSLKAKRFIEEVPRFFQD